MYAIVVLNLDSLSFQVETVIFRNTLESAVDRAVSVAADLNLFDTENEEEELAVGEALRDAIGFVKNNIKIVIQRSFE